LLYGSLRCCPVTDANETYPSEECKLGNLFEEVINLGHVFVKGVDMVFD
jgi:hypothetical protein